MIEINARKKAEENKLNKRCNKPEEFLEGTIPCPICGKLAEDEVNDENNICKRHLVLKHEGNNFIYMRYDIFTGAFNCK